MKVKELIEQLKRYEEKNIIFSQDEEGNAKQRSCNVIPFEEMKNTVCLYPFEYIT